MLLNWILLVFWLPLNYFRCQSQPIEIRFGSGQCQFCLFFPLWQVPSFYLDANRLTWLVLLACAQCTFCGSTKQENKSWFLLPKQWPACVWQKKNLRLSLKIDCYFSRFTSVSFHHYLSFFKCFLREVSPCGWTDWAVWTSTQCLGMFNISDGKREGSDIGLLPDIELEWVE